MSTSSQVSLGALRLQAQQRTGMENNGAISTPEWNSYATASYKELYDMLIAAYGNDYYVANTYQFTTNSAQLYPLPDGTGSYLDTTGGTAAKFYKLLGVDLQFSASPTGWITLKRFETIERNKYFYPNGLLGRNYYSNLRYRVQGSNIYLVPIPQSGQTLQLWYAPAPTSLQYLLPCNTTLSSTTVTLSDTTGLSVGMNVYGTGVSDTPTISAVGSTSVTISSLATSTRTGTALAFWSDATQIDGIAGWEEYVIVDMAIKCQVKQENDPTGFMQQKAELKARIEGMAEGRDIGQAHHVSDALSISGFDDDGMGGYGGAGGRF